MSCSNFIINKIWIHCSSTGMALLCARDAIHMSTSMSMGNGK